jgi:hypothetical protein
LPQDLSFARCPNWKNALIGAGSTVTRDVPEETSLSAIGKAAWFGQNVLNKNGERDIPGARHLRGECLGWELDMSSGKSTRKSRAAAITDARFFR